MAVQQHIELPEQVITYLMAHRIVTVGTASFTGMPRRHDRVCKRRGPALFLDAPDELTLLNIDANHWASFTIDDYTPDFRKPRERRGVGQGVHPRSRR